MNVRLYRATFPFFLRVVGRRPTWLDAQRPDDREEALGQELSTLVQ